MMSTRASPVLVFRRCRYPFECSLCHDQVRRGVRVQFAGSPCHWAMCDDCAERIGELAWDTRARPIRVHACPLALRDIG